MAAARLDFANTPDDAVDNLRFYDRQQAYVSARPRSAHKTRIEQQGKLMPPGGTRDTIAQPALDKAARRTARSTLELLRLLIASLLPQYDF